MTAIELGAVVGGDFRVGRHLASGAMGSVFECEQLSTGKTRALKVMSRELARNPRARDRFVLEARVGAKIDSAHVVEVVSAGIDSESGSPYLVMELLKGEELGETLRREGSLPLRDVALILKQLGHALALAHESGIVHRDLKPSNVFLGESRRHGAPFTIKILDFGIAKLVAECTAAGTQAVGTPLFMAPEQSERDGQISAQTDVWALGLLAFYLLTGHNYWLSADAPLPSLIREVVLEPLAVASERAAVFGEKARLPTGFDGWFARCVNRNVAARFESARSCVAAFSELVLTEAEPGVLGESTEFSEYPAPRRSRGGQSSGGTEMAMAATELEASGPGQPGADEAGRAERGASFQGGTRRGRLAMLAAVLVIGAGGGLALYGGGSRAVPAGGEELSGPAAAATSLPSAEVVAPAVLAGDATAATSCPAGMVEVQAGSMFMGSTDSDLRDDVRPPHKVKLSGFCIDIHEVTVGAYEACASAGHCPRAPVDVSIEGLDEKARKVYSALCNGRDPKRKDHPINCLDWEMARTYCEDAGGRLASGGARLLSEAEWEFAARGASQRTYPWGDAAPGASLLNACGDECLSWRSKSKLKSFGAMFEGSDGHAATAPVGSYPAGASADGVMDLAGNVWEWTGDWYGPYARERQRNPKGPQNGQARVVRGGGFNGAQPAWAKPAWRWKAPPEMRSHGVGFRCGVSLAPEG